VKYVHCVLPDSHLVFASGQFGLVSGQFGPTREPDQARFPDRS
jgi:hypothetical protein